MNREYGEHGRASAAVRAWRVSMRLHHAGHPRVARLTKAMNYILFRAILPPQAVVGRDLRLGHGGLGVVVHPNTRIGSRVRIWHHVTIASSADVGSDDRVLIGDDVEIGAGAVLLNKRGRTLRIGDGATIGANTTVTRDVAPGSTFVGPAGRAILGSTAKSSDD